MSPVKKIIVALILIVWGRFLYFCEFVEYLRAYKPTPWWDMGCWFYYATLYFYEAMSIGLMAFGLAMLIALGVRKFKRILTSYV